MDKFAQIMAKRRAGLSLESAIIEVNEEERQAAKPDTMPVLPDGELKDEVDINGILQDDGIDVVVQDYDTVVAVTDDMVRISDGASTLAQISIGVEAHVVNDTPMSDSALYFAKLGIKYAVDGMFDHKLVSPSQESYLDPMEYTLSLEEGIKETLKNFWEGLKSKLKALQTKVRTWYLKVFDATPRLRKQAEDLRARAESANGTPKENSFEAGGVSKLSINGKVPTPDQLIQGLQDISNISETMLSKSAGTYTELTKRLGDYATQQAEHLAKAYPSSGDVDDQGAAKSVSSTDTAGSVKLISECGAMYADTVKAVKATNTVKPEKNRFKEPGVNYSSTGQLLGSCMLVFSVPLQNYENQRNDINGLQRAMGQSIEPIKDGAKPSDDDKGQYTTMNPQQIARAMDGVLQICDSVMKYKEAFAAREAAQVKIERDLDNAIKKAEGMNATGARIMRMSCQAAVSVQRKLTNGEGAWVRYAMGTAKLAYGYANKSMGMIG